MPKIVDGLRWGVEQRLEFIEFRLFWEGGVNRSDIIDTFGVSVPQASKDLTLYQERAPHNMIYDKSAKRYIAAGGFKPQFLNPDPDAFLSRLQAVVEGADWQRDSWISAAPDADVALTPKRDVDGDVLRAVLNAIRNRRSIDVMYQSMNPQRPDPKWRRITPHAFGYDGFRWHARAFCHLEETFKDFLLPRILKSRGEDEPGASGEADHFWHEYYPLEIAPHPALTSSQQEVVAKDYGMKGRKCVLRVRVAMLFYVMKRLGLLNDAVNEDPRRQHIVLLNEADAKRVLELANTGRIVREAAVGRETAG
ncbi:WYL domain-containing protein [Mesorhizobium sp. LHD-90]|uniref:WYL domain-containing protein n=1 Tax=Mesorhizobium sp. LHD-90 TaxID=3071414 RepID=UPI0027DF3821|nr:WYL domain-containing protein [Mesorhizobium sp. LHD-90]MDQ6436336.1 WYL domain-containing protein [Mesorhizobium sp. LHD-90]